MLLPGEVVWLMLIATVMLGSGPIDQEATAGKPMTE